MKIYLLVEGYGEVEAAPYFCGACWQKPGALAST